MYYSISFISTVIEVQSQRLLGIIKANALSWLDLNLFLKLIHQSVREWCLKHSLQTPSWSRILQSLRGCWVIIYHTLFIPNPTNSSYFCKSIVGLLTWKWSSVALPPMLRTFRELARFMLQPGQWTCKDKLIRMAENYSSKNTRTTTSNAQWRGGNNASKLIWGTAFKVTTTELQIYLHSHLITYKPPQITSSLELKHFRQLI